MKRTRRINRRTYYVRIPWNNWKSSISLLNFHWKGTNWMWYILLWKIFLFTRRKRTATRKKEINKLNRMILWRILWKVVRYINENEGKMQPFEFEILFLFTFVLQRADSMKVIPLFGINLKLSHEWCSVSIWLYSLKAICLLKVNNQQGENQTKEKSFDEIFGWHFIIKRHQKQKHQKPLAVDKRA